MNPPRLLGVVLAGGQSSRMGRDKAGLPSADGKTFLQHAIARITSVCDAVCVSGPITLSADVRLIADPVTFRGPAVGVASALQIAQQESFDACLFTPVDMPHLTVSDLLRLKQRWQHRNLLTLGFCESIQPLIGIYPVALADQIEALAASPHRSLSRWVQTQEIQSVELPASSCLNINTPDDLIDGC